jgi:hypothetical protein
MHLRTPKLLLLILSFALAYGLYHIGVFDVLEHMFSGFGYIAVFIGGMLFSFGFTSAFGIAIIAAAAQDVHPILGALIAGFGAMLVDMTIFEFIRFSFDEELHVIRGTRAFVFLHKILHHQSFPQKLREYLLWSFAGIVIASPLPDEIGVMLVSGLSDLDPRRFAAFCFCCNVFGAFCILMLARIAG